MHGRGNEDVGGEDGEIVQPELLSLDDGHGVSWCGGFKTNRKENNFPLGILRAILTASMGNKLPEPPPEARTEKRSPCEPGTRSISPKEVKITSGCCAIHKA